MRSKHGYLICHALLHHTFVSWDGSFEVLERVCFILLSIASSRSLELLSFEQIIKEFVQERSILLDGVAD